MGAYGGTMVGGDQMATTAYSLTKLLQIIMPTLKYRISLTASQVTKIYSDYSSSGKMLDRESLEIVQSFEFAASQILSERKKPDVKIVSMAEKMELEPPVTESVAEKKKRLYDLWENNPALVKAEDLEIVHNYRRYSGMMNPEEQEEWDKKMREKSAEEMAKLKF